MSTPTHLLLQHQPHAMSILTTMCVFNTSTPHEHATHLLLRHQPHAMSILTTMCVFNTSTPHEHTTHLLLRAAATVGPPDLPPSGHSKPPSSALPISTLALAPKPINSRAFCCWTVSHRLLSSCCWTVSYRLLSSCGWSALLLLLTHRLPSSGPSSQPPASASILRMLEGWVSLSVLRGR